MANPNDGRFLWYENITKDPKAAIAFYSDVIGWQILRARSSPCTICLQSSALSSSR
jgi:predicted enzyme related to lactoylglutathione lyase